MAGFRGEPRLKLSICLSIALSHCHDIVHRCSLSPPSKTTLVKHCLEPQMTISQNEYCWNNSCTVGPYSVKRRLWSPGTPLVSALELEVEQEGETGLFVCCRSWFTKGAVSNKCVFFGDFWHHSRQPACVSHGDSKFVWHYLPVETSSHEGFKSSCTDEAVWS